MALRDWYLAFVPNEATAFDPVAHARRDVDLQSVSVTSEEEKETVVTISVAPGDRPLITAAPSWAWLSYETPGGVVPIAKLRRIKIPFRRAETSLQVDFVCRASDHEARVRAAILPVAQSNDFDPLFASATAQLDPVEVLDATTKCVHTDPVTHAVSVTEMIGVAPLRTLDDSDLAGWEDDGGVQMTLRDIPIREVAVTLSAEWTQVIGGEVDLTPLLQFASGGPTISTLTPDAFERSWPRPGSSLNGDSGYTITEARLRRIAVQPPQFRRFVGSSQSYNYVTDSDLSTPIPRNVDVEVARYVASMRAAWRTEQKRVETVTFRVRDGGQEIGLGEVRALDLRCEDVTVDRSGTPEYQQGLYYNQGNVVRALGRRWVATVAHQAETPSFEGDLYRIEGGILVTRWAQAEDDGSALGGIDRASYFTQGRGVSTIRVAALKARRLLALARRCVEVRLAAPLEDVTDLRIAHGLRIESDEVPGGALQGKITGITISDSGDGAMAVITLSCAPGSGAAGVAPGPGDLNANYSAAVWDRLAFGFPGVGIPAAPVPGGAIFLLNGVDDQEIYTAARGYSVAEDRTDPTATKPSEILKDVPTTLLFALTPLSSAADLTWTINLGTAVWQGPREIEAD